MSPRGAHVGPPVDTPIDEQEATSLFGRARGFLRRLDRRVYAWVAIALCGMVLSTRFWPWQVAHPLNLFEAYAAYAMLPIWPALAYARWRRLSQLTAGCLFFALAHLGWVFDFVPRLGSDDVEGTPLRLLTANLLAPAGSQAFAREILSADADVIVASELSDRWSELFEEEGIYAAYPYARSEVIPASESYFGIGVLSRHPITDHAIEHIDGIPLIRADLDVRGTPVRLYGFHAHPPTGRGPLAVWETQMAWLEERVGDDIAAHRRVILTGDFNTTTMTRGYRRLLGLDLVAVHEAAMRPWSTTWPNGLWIFPPVRIDHVFVHGLGVRAVSEGVGDGSDHRPIVSELVVRPLE